MNNTAALIHVSMLFVRVVTGRFSLYARSLPFLVSGIGRACVDSSVQLGSFAVALCK